MLPWLLFSETVQRSASSLLDQANLITKTVFPAEIIPVSVFLSSLVSHLLALGLLVVTAGLYAKHLSAFVLLLPVYMLAIGLFAIGLGWVVASIHVFLRDTAQIVSVLLTLWFWLTPIMIPPSRYPGPAKIILFANPLYYVVRAYRTLLLGTQWPDLRDLAVALACSAVAFVLGGLFFRHMKRGFADVL